MLIINFIFLFTDYVNKNIPPTPNNIGKAKNKEKIYKLIKRKSCKKNILLYLTIKKIKIYKKIYYL